MSRTIFEADMFHGKGLGNTVTGYVRISMLFIKITQHTSATTIKTSNVAS
jgi:hypothetical protein